MKKPIYIFIFALVCLPMLFASESEIIIWGVATNNLKMSIHVVSGSNKTFVNAKPVPLKNNEVEVNSEFTLFLFFMNTSTNQPYYTHFALDPDPFNGVSVVIVSPLGSDVSPAFKPSGFANGVVSVPPGGTNGFAFPLSQFFKFSKVGTYKVTVRKEFHVLTNQTNKFYPFIVESQQLLVKVIPDK